MKKMLMATTAAALFATGAYAGSHSNEVKLGIVFGFTGPIESLTAPMASGAEMAMKEVTDSGKLMGGATVTPLRADSGCIDNALAVAGAERLIAEGINGLIGADCSGVTGAVLQNVAIPNGMAMISPSATSPGLSTMEDNGLFFRTSPSDAREGQVMAEILQERGVKSIALTYTNNDYGKGLADAIQTSPSLQPMKTAKPITLPKLARWHLPVAKSWLLRVTLTKAVLASSTPRWTQVHSTHSACPAG